MWQFWEKTQKWEFRKWEVERTIREVKAIAEQMHGNHTQCLVSLVNSDTAPWKYCMCFSVFKLSHCSTFHPSGGKRLHKLNLTLILLLLFLFPLPLPRTLYLSSLLHPIRPDETNPNPHAGHLPPPKTNRRTHSIMHTQCLTGAGYLFWSYSCFRSKTGISKRT